MIVAAVPVKRLTGVKSRLSPLLTPLERAALLLALLDRTIHALRDSGAVDAVALVTPDRALAERFGTDWLPDGYDLNNALRGAAAWAMDARAHSLLIMPADLPQVESEDVRALVREIGEPPSVVVSSTVDGGTSALLLSPPNVIEPAFGPASARRHVLAAVDARVAVRHVTGSGLGVDLDTVSDLQPFLDGIGA